MAPPARKAPQKVVVVNEDRLREVVKESVKDAFTAIGFDINNPIEMQKDLNYLRSWREIVHKGGMRALTTAIGLAVIAGVGAVLVGLGVPVKVLGFMGLAAQQAQ